MQMEGFFSQAALKGGQIPTDKSHIREETMNSEHFPVLFPLRHPQPSGSIPMAAHCQGAWVAFRAEFVPQDAEFAAF